MDENNDDKNLFNEIIGSVDFDDDDIFGDVGWSDA